MWVAAAHIFGGERCVRRINKFLLWTLAIYWISGLARLDPKLFSGGQVVGVIRGNTASAIAAIVLLWTVYRAKSNGWRRNAVMFVVAATSLVAFGSLASAIALLLALIALKMSSFHAGLKFKTAALCTIAAIGMLYGVLVAQSQVPSLSAATVSAFGAVSEKTAEKILTLDGRIPLWIAIWNVTKDKPWGSGYAAAERTFEADASSLNWAPGNAHSGYVSAWFGAGWAGVAMVLLVFWSMWAQRKRLPRHLQPILIALLVLLAINNASIPGVGGRSNPVFIFMMALACIPPALRHRFPEEAKVLATSIPILQPTTQS
jgi:O-antigen ligase